jgi:probable non-F420 flavinoid oxidoreductase
MVTVGFHASHEQVHPRELLAAVRHAETAGFGAAMCSDHIAPWSERQGHSAFAWSWLGSALEATDFSLGVVNAPGQRYHPAVIAQAIATLGAMYPGRFWSALGSGENSNEHITGDAWPRKAERNERLLECVHIIRALLAGEEVSHNGLVTVDRARVWTLPDVTPLLIGAAVSVETAGWVAEWADGMATVAQPVDHLKRMVGAYRDAGGRGELTLQVHVSWAPSDEEALAIAHDQWRSNVLGPPLAWDLDTPAAFDAATRHVRPDDMRDTVLVASNPAAFVEAIHEYAALGFDRIYLHNVGKEQTPFIDEFAENVLPRVEGTRA